ncbi:MAG: LysR family transcriptional regulator [Shinella sp.]|nr:MAG: LysR family transcriptional regulator [Shinella sp.]
MDHASLCVFRAVAREQSVTRAAALLGRAPSNVTTRIQQIEAELEVPLFQRDTRRMLLTPEGETFLDYVERILNLADEALQMVNPRTQAGVLRIGSMEATAATRLPVPLAQFNAAWPQVTIDLTTGPSRSLVDAVLARRIDCALVAITGKHEWLAPGEVDLVPLFHEELVLLLPPGHPRVEHPRDVKPQALAAFAPGCTYRMLAEDWISGHGEPAGRFRIHEVRSYHAMVACTAAGSCFSILPRRVLALMPDAACFTVKPLTTATTSLATRPGYGTPAFLAFRTILETFADADGGSGAHAR